MNETLLTGIIGAATMALGWILGGKKKAKLEEKQAIATVHSTELDAIDKAVGIWRNLAQDLKKEVDELRTLVTALRIENDKLSSQVSGLSIENQNLREEINELRTQVAINSKLGGH